MEVQDETHHDPTELTGTADNATGIATSIPEQPNFDLPQILVTTTTAVEEQPGPAEMVEALSSVDEQDQTISRSSKCQKVADSLSDSKIMAYIMMVFVILSTLEIVFSSVALFQNEDGSQHRALAVLEFLCVAWFTLEFLVRLCSAPSFKAFALDFMNIIDFLTVFPFYLEKVLLYAALESTWLGDIQAVSMAMRVLRVLRILRVFKLARYNQRMTVFFKSLKDSSKEFLMILIYLCLVVFLFSSTIYYVEKDYNSAVFKGMKHSRLPKRCSS